MKPFFHKTVLLTAGLFMYNIIMAPSRNCKQSDDSFCYICGYYIGPKQPKYQLLGGTKLWTGYSAYFGIQIGDQDKKWAPRASCGTCRSTLEGWLREIGKVCHFGENQRTTLQTATSIWLIY